MAARRLSMRKIKEVLRLHCENGFSARQIAKSLDISRSTIREYLDRAKRAGVSWPLPLELDEVYPLSQHEAAHPFDLETVNYVANQTAEYIERSPYQSVVLLNDPKHWGDIVKKVSQKVCSTKSLEFDSVDASVQGSKEIFSRLDAILREQLSK